jgi:hypothetical protein
VATPPAFDRFDAPKTVQVARSRKSVAESFNLGNFGPPKLGTILAVSVDQDIADRVRASEAFKNRFSRLP